MDHGRVAQDRGTGARERRAVAGCGSGWWTGQRPGLNVTPMDRRLDRRLVALATAYAVALGTLLPVLTFMLLPAASGTLGPAIICAGADRAGSASDGDAPEQPRPPCPCPGACAMAGCAATILPPVGAALAPAAWPSLRSVALGRDGGNTRVVWLGGRNLARGPPFA
jgi:hypothetical protein